jgi:3-oxoacyl-[acyl-carrier protein] reductase
MTIDFTEKIILITGATRGIGKEIAKCMSSMGGNLILTGTNQEEIIKLNEQCRADGITNIHYLQCDLSDSRSTDIFLQEIDKYKRIDVCVNNAGVNLVNNFTDTSFDDFIYMSHINLFGPYKILKVVGSKMMNNNYGRIVNIASIWSVITRPGRSMYTTTKNAIVGMTKTLSVEWALHNILVNAVSPGFTLTELTKNTNTKEEIMVLENMIPAKRMCQPIEQARVIAFLCSDLNTYITGQNIIVDGGYTNV